MTIFLLSFFFIAIMVGAMAVGVIFSNKPIKGSCGGIQALGMGGDCDICGGDTNKCEEENRRAEGAAQGYLNSRTLLKEEQGGSVKHFDPRQR